MVESDRKNWEDMCVMECAVCVCEREQERDIEREREGKQRDSDDCLGLTPNT